METKEILKALRKSHNCTAKEVAEGCDISLGVYQKYETGERNIGVPALIKLSKYYNVSTDYLLGINEDEPKELVDLIGERYHLDSVSRGLVAMYIELEPKERKKFIEELKKVVCKDCDKSKP